MWYPECSLTKPFRIRLLALPFAHNAESTNSTAADEAPFSGSGVAALVEGEWWARARLLDAARARYVSASTLVGKPLWARFGAAGQPRTGMDGPPWQVSAYRAHHSPTRARLRYIADTYLVRSVAK